MTTSYTCPACSGKLKTVTVDGISLEECRSCGALTSNAIYLGQSYQLVLPRWETGDYDQSEQRYFDFTCLGSEGITRRHGWYLPRTKRITQVG